MFQYLVVEDTYKRAGYVKQKREKWETSMLWRTKQITDQVKTASQYLEIAEHI